MGWNCKTDLAFPDSWSDTPCTCTALCFGGLGRSNGKYLFKVWPDLRQFGPLLAQLRQIHSKRVSAAPLIDPINLELSNSVAAQFGVRSTAVSPWIESQFVQLRLTCKCKQLHVFRRPRCTFCEHTIKSFKPVTFLYIQSGFKLYTML